ncbi:cell division protein FtsQ/DivIB [Neptunicoccus cionae]|uniref:Cell division protein FtsQ n=1 Tax=Neptunicoccus cionae TaxID=2035344 RepID=A0A916QSN6_9RHOB|nr:cell division protein FtsQ/DivIB [Amylibacter cionae]GGA07859.1 cell division protein FtsQ [Amylibacter cionae]
MSAIDMPRQRLVYRDPDTQPSYTERMERSAHQSTARPDPSPSRIKYRLERIWLTPLYRSLIRTGLPIAIVVGLVANHFSDPVVQARLAESVTNARTMIENRPEFAVNLMQVQGGSTSVSKQVREAIPMVFPVSSLQLDLAALKEKIEAIDAVKSAGVFLRGGVLDVEIVERVPALVWRGADHLELVDKVGARAGVLEAREGYLELPLILGTGAQAHASEALRLLAAAGPLSDRIRGLRRVGERRWDVMLDRGQIIQLPVAHPVAALERVVALQRARDLLGRDVTVVDMRDGRRPVLRLTAAAVEELHRLRAIADGESET